MITVPQLCGTDDWGDGWEDLPDENMEWAKPEFKRGDVDRAGRRLAELLSKVDLWEAKDYSDYAMAISIINNWRSAHAYILNTFQATLRLKSRKLDVNAIVAQRTKRLWSIWHKLDRFKTMQLSQMQDIAGIRAIVASNDQAKQLP